MAGEGSTATAGEGQEYSDSDAFTVEQFEEHARITRLMMNHYTDDEEGECESDEDPTAFFDWDAYSARVAEWKKEMYPNKSAWTMSEEQRRGKLSYRCAAAIATPRADDDFVPETEEEAEAAVQAAAAAAAEAAEAAAATEAEAAAAAAASSPTSQVHVEELAALSSPVGLLVEPPTSPVASPGLLMSSPLGCAVSPSRWPTHSPSTRAQWGAWRAFKGAWRRQVSDRLGGGGGSSSQAVPSPIRAEGAVPSPMGAAGAEVEQMATASTTAAAAAAVHGAAARSTAPDCGAGGDAAAEPTPVRSKPVLPIFRPVPASSTSDAEPAPTATPTASTAGAFSARGAPGSNVSLASRMAQRRKESFDRRRAGKAAGAGSARGVKGAVARGLAFAGMGSREDSPRTSPSARAAAPGDERA